MAKTFVKLSSMKALKNANLDKTTAEKAIEAAKAEVLADNSRANRKTLNRAEVKLAKAEKRIDHIEVAMGYQNEKHEKKFVLKKEKEGTKMKKARKFKSFNEASIAKPSTRERSVWKDAKESAKWMRKLLDEQDMANVETMRAKPVIDIISGQRAEFRRYWNNLHAEPVKYFSVLEKVKDKEWREHVNNEAVAQLGHPAMAAAMVFSKGLMAASDLLGRNAGELGGKAIFTGLDMRIDALNDVEAQIDDVKELYEMNVAEWPELHEKVQECIKFEAWDDLDVLHERYNLNKESNAYLKNKRRELMAQKNTLKAELKVLRSALKELRQDAVGAQKALVEARVEAFAAHRKDKKERKAGRPIIPCPKPMLKGYKMMHFTVDAWQKNFASIINDINTKADKCWNVDGEDEADDELKKAKNELVKTFDKAVETLKQLKDKGTKLKLNAENAKVHNARQSQLADVIGVPYGKTTNMIISVSHNVAGIFNMNVEKYLGDDEEKVTEKIEEFMEALLDIITVNGIELTTLSVDGKAMVLDYKFWNSNNSQLKVGKFVALSSKAYEKAAEVGRAGMTEEEYEQVKTNGSDMLKYWSYATTPGAPLFYDGKPLTINDVLVVDSIDTLRKFRNVLKFKEDGTSELVDVAEIKRTMSDGGMYFLVPIPSQQLRGGFCIKGFGTCCAYEDGTTMIDEIAKREGWNIPEYIEDIDGNMKRWRDYKVICTKDAWKWAGWKFGKEERQFTYAEYCARMNELAKKYPCANMLYTARIADATEESKRRLTRQSIQQFMTATNDCIAKLYAKSIRKIQKLNTWAGVIRKMAGLDKPEEERTDFEHLVEVYPELLDHPYMKRAVEDMFNRQVAEAAVRPEVDGIYPYIIEDPVVFFKVVFWKVSPNQTKTGYLTSSQVNVPNEEEGTPLYIVRYPNNYLCGQVRVNHNDDIYRCVGNVMVLPVDGGILTWADGDTDGDEMCVIRNREVVDMMADVKRELRPPMVDFPHDKLDKNIIIGRVARAHALSHAMVVANKYGPEVGKNSNLATKFFNRASIAYRAWKATNDKKAKWNMDKAIENATIAHIAAIIAIDLAKTGKMPKWLEEKLKAIRKFAGKKMPWNQRFCKDNKATPWFDASWNEEVLEESDSIVDRGARYVIDKTKAEGYVAPTGNNFNIDDLLGPKTGLIVVGSNGKLTQTGFRKLEARNYKTKSTNTEDDDEYKLINLMKSTDEKDVIGGTDLMRFLWRNMASLVYVLQRDGEDKMTNALMQNAYYEFCHDVLANFGSFCGTNERFVALSPELQLKSNVWKFVNNAFKDKNGIANKLNPETDAELIFSKKASFALFTVKVFAYDMYNMVCDKKGITDRWVKPVESAATDCADIGEETVFIGFTNVECDELYCDEID